MFPATTCAHVVVRVFVVVTFFTVVVLHVVAASITPEVHIAVATTSSGGSGHTKLTGNLSPSIQWNTEGSVAGCSYEVRVVLLFYICTLFLANDNKARHTGIYCAFDPYWIASKKMLTHSNIIAFFFLYFWGAGHIGFEIGRSSPYRERFVHG